MLKVMTIVAVFQIAKSFNQVKMIKPSEFCDHVTHFSYALSSSSFANPGSDQPLADEISKKRWSRKPTSESSKTIDDIWAGFSIETSHSELLRDAIHSAREKVGRRANIRPVNPIDELTRYEAYSRLRQRMFELVRAENCDSRRGWIRAFERWQYLSKNYEWSDDGARFFENLASLDPLLPSLPLNSPAEVNLFEDLQKLDGISFDAAKRVSRKIQDDSSKLSSALYKRMALRIQKAATAPAAQGIDDNGDDQSNNNETNSGSKNIGSVNIVSNQYNGDLRVSLQEDASVESYSKRFRVFSISATHAEKLRLLWNHRRETLDPMLPGLKDSIGDSDNNKETSRVSNSQFDDDLFCLLARYSVLEGYGWQAAIAQPVLAALNKNFGVTVECFSSPLNNFLPTYCSFFPDTDAAFGSVGSFFDFQPSEGSFEANPPFVASLMVQMVLRMDSLLTAATGPMSFAVVVPAWCEDAHWPHLLTSNFNKGYFIVPATEHSYCDGRQHGSSIDERYRPAPFDTAVFFLQNAEGAKKWPLTSQSKAELIEAFAAARTSQESSQDRNVYIPKFKRPKEA